MEILNTIFNGMIAIPAFITFCSITIILILKFLYRPYYKSSLDEMIQSFNMYLERELNNKHESKKIFEQRVQLQTAFEIEFGNNDYLRKFKKGDILPKKLNIFKIFKNYIKAYCKKRKDNIYMYYFEGNDTTLI